MPSRKPSPLEKKKEKAILDMRKHIACLERKIEILQDIPEHMDLMLMTGMYTIVNGRWTKKDQSMIAHVHTFNLTTIRFKILALESNSRLYQNLERYTNKKGKVLFPLRVEDIISYRKFEMEDWPLCINWIWLSDEIRIKYNLA